MSETFFLEQPVVAGCVTFALTTVPALLVVFVFGRRKKRPASVYEER